MAPSDRRVGFTVWEPHEVVHSNGNKARTPLLPLRDPMAREVMGWCCLEYDMGHNPKYSQWRAENWKGYCPTIGDMARKEWNLTAQCWTCRLEMHVDIARVVRATGPTWSPWGKSARCRRLGCTGRMKLKAYAPGPGQYVDI